MPVLIENKKINNKYLIYYFKFDRKHNFINENVEHLLSLDKWLSIDQWIEIYDKLEKQANNYVQNNKKNLKNIFTDKHRMSLEIEWKPLTNELKNVLDLQNQIFYDDYIFITIKTVSKFDSYIHSLHDRIHDVTNEKDDIPKDSINKKKKCIHNNSENKEYEEYIPAGVSSIITNTYKPMSLDKSFKNEEYSPSTSSSDLFGDVSNSPSATYMPNSTNPLQYTPKRYKRKHSNISTPKHNFDISCSLSSISNPSPVIISETYPENHLNTKDSLADFVNKCKLEHYNVKKRNVSPVEQSIPEASVNVADNIRSNEKQIKSKKDDLFNDIIDNSINIQEYKSSRNSKKRFDNLRESKMGTKLYNSKSKQPKIDKQLITQTGDRNSWLQARGGTPNATIPSKITSTSLIDPPSKLTTELFQNMNNNDYGNKNIENYSRIVSNGKLTKKICVENENEFTANGESSHKNLPETYKKIEIFNLKFMTNEQIKGSFKENKLMLKKLIAEYDPSIKVKPPYFMEDICNSEQKIFMLNLLQGTFFDKNLHGITGPTPILFELLLPEWELSIFMKKFKLTREEAINRIHAQNEHDDDFSMDSFNMS